MVRLSGLLYLLALAHTVKAVSIPGTSNDALRELEHTGDWMKPTTGTDSKGAQPVAKGRKGLVERWSGDYERGGLGMGRQTARIHGDKVEGRVPGLLISRLI
jgi:hypothetical protein